MFNIVKKAIDEFNPFGLLPDDEFDSESRTITELIKTDNTVDEIAYIEGGTVVWNNGEIDIAPETLYNNSFKYEGIYLKAD